MRDADLGVQRLYWHGVTLGELRLVPIWVDSGTLGNLIQPGNYGKYPPDYLRNATHETLQPIRTVKKARVI